MVGLLVAVGVLAAAESRQRGRELRSVEVVYDPPGVKYGLARASLEERGWWRDRAPAPRREGRARVLVVGDSVSWGVGVRADEAWPARLGERLDVEVVNLAMNGWDASQSASLLEAVGAAWAPHAVLYGAYTNDGIPTRLVYGEATRDPVFVGTDVPDASRILPPPLSAWLLARSALFRRLQGAAHARVAEGVARDFDAAWFGAQLDRLRAWSAANDVPVGIVALPPHVLADPVQCAAEMPEPALCDVATRAHAAILDAAASRDLPFADALAALRTKEPSSHHPRARKDPDHPGPTGHAAFADAAAPLARRLLGIAEPPVRDAPEPQDRAERSPPRREPPSIPDAARKGPRVPRAGKAAGPRGIRRPNGSGGMPR
jgi:lysophospholipase L1-like esterase